jgi:hypothetical protein
LEVCKPCTLRSLDGRSGICADHLIVDFRALNTDGAYRSNGKFDLCISGHGPPLSAANLDVAAEGDRKNGVRDVRNFQQLRTPAASGRQANPYRNPNVRW